MLKSSPIKSTVSQSIQKTVDFTCDFACDFTCDFTYNFTCDVRGGTSANMSQGNDRREHSALWNPGTDELVTWMSIPDVGLIGAGKWAFVSNAYLGVSFTATDGAHFGWVQITSYPDMRAHIHSWAYESQPGVEILAGVVPEPSTIHLGLIGIGVIVLAAWRQRAAKT